MWASLRSDLKEFVTSVTEDTTTVLEAIDSKLTEQDEQRLLDDDDDNNDDGNENEGQQSEVVIGEDGEVAYVGGDGDTATYEQTGIVVTAADELVRLGGLEETYLEPLLWPEGRDEMILKEANGKRKKNGGEEVAAVTDEKEEEKGKDDMKPAAEKGDAENSTETETEDKNEIEDNTAKEEEQTSNADDKSDNKEESSPLEQKEEYEEEEETEESSEIKSFLQTFQISTKTDEISSILSQHPHTVKPHFEQLVPTVISYELFWARYFYRCNEFRIETTWERQRQEAKRARQEAISGGIRNVKNLLGGAVKAVSHIVNDEETDRSAPVSGSSAYETYRSDPTMMAVSSSTVDAQTGSSGLGSSLFGVGGRPPFVMNTAVSDDDENEQEPDEESEEDDEEELGWDDEDDDDYETDDDDDGDDDEESQQSEQIVFGSPQRQPQESEITTLKKQLSEMEAERDQLHQTVEMQTQEISNLRSATTEGGGTNVGVSSSSNKTDKDEIERLQMLIFEKDSELAAIKASLGDTHEDDHDHHDHHGNDNENNKKVQAAQLLELQKLQKELRAKEDELSQLQKKSIAMKEELQNVKESLEHTKSELEQAQIQITTYNTTTAQNKAETNSAQSKITSLSSNLETEQNKNKEAQVLITSLQAELEKLKEEMEQQNVNFAVTLEEEISRVREEMQREQEHKQHEESSASSGVVKVSKPSSHDDDGTGAGGDLPKDSVADQMDDDDDDDDWGDW